MMNCVPDSLLLCVCACVHVLGSLPLGLNRIVLLQFHATMKWSYGERCSLLRCDIVRVAMPFDVRLAVPKVGDRGWCRSLTTGARV
jgi:hypothetical protein